MGELHRHHAIAGLLALLDQRQRNLRYLELQEATYVSGHAPVELRNQIDQEREAIKVLQAEMADLGGSLSAEQPAISAGPTALINLLQSPQVRDVVSAFRYDFAASCEQIDVLATYKDIHDLLHDLQFRCYDCMLSEMRAFPDDELAIERLDNYALTLREIIDQLQDIAERSLFATTETSWLKDLVQSGVLLRAALEGADTVALKRAIRLLNRILSVHPKSINDRLIATARTLRLHTLVDVMSQLRDQLATMAVEERQLHLLNTGVSTLIGLNGIFEVLVLDHNAWQVIDSDFRRIEAVLHLDTLELEDSWPSLSRQIQERCMLSDEPWASELRTEVARLTRTIAEQSSSISRRTFRNCRRLASLRFYRVDTALKRTCDQLRLFRNPLDELQRMLV